MRVLLVDSDPVVLELIPQLVDQYDWEVALNLSTALEIIKNKELAVVVVDSLDVNERIEIAEICIALKIKIISLTNGMATEDDVFDAKILKPDITELGRYLNFFVGAFSEIKK